MEKTNNPLDEAAKEQLEYLGEVSQKKFARPLAIVGLVIIIGLIITTFILGIIGSEYFIGFLFLSIMTPVFIYVFLWIGKLVRSVSKK